MAQSYLKEKKERRHIHIGYCIIWDNFLKHAIHGGEEGRYLFMNRYGFRIKTETRKTESLDIDKIIRGYP